jgi:hypothetical protein
MFSFISLDKDVRLKPLLCAATSNHPAWQGAVCTLLNGRLRFSYYFHDKINATAVKVKFQSKKSELHISKIILAFLFFKKKARIKLANA